MSEKSLGLTSNQVETGMKWGDSKSEMTRAVEKPDFTSEAEMRTLGISAAC